jgi:hypothetical protein
MRSAFEKKANKYKEIMLYAVFQHPHLLYSYGEFLVVVSRFQASAQKQREQAKNVRKQRVS